MSNGKEGIDVPFDEVLHDTGEAVLLKIADREVWLPLSAIDDIDEDDKIAVVHRWLVEKEGLD